MERGALFFRAEIQRNVPEGRETDRRVRLGRGQKITRFESLTQDLARLEASVRASSSQHKPARAESSQCVLYERASASQFQSALANLAARQSCVKLSLRTFERATLRVLSN